MEIYRCRNGDYLLQPHPAVLPPEGADEDPSYLGVILGDRFSAEIRLEVERQLTSDAFARLTRHQFLYEERR